MGWILKLIGNEEVIEYSTIYVDSSKVIVRKNRARIVLNFMGNPKIMDVGIEILARFDRARQDSKAIRKRILLCVAGDRIPPEDS